MPKKTVALNSRIAAHTGIRQIEALGKLDAMGAHADAAINRWWNSLLKWLKDPPKVHVYQHAVTHLRGLRPAVLAGMETGLTRVAKWAHKSSAETILKTVPVDYLRAAAIRLQEGKEFAGVPLLEDEGGLIQLAIAGTRKLVVGKAIRSLKGPTARALDEIGWQNLLRQVLFPPPPLEQIVAIIQRPLAGLRWWERLAQATKLSDSPEILGNIIALGFSQGKNPVQVARDLMPAVQEVRATAKRIARTYGMDIVHQVQQQQYEKLGDLKIGQQIHAQLDQNTRPEHAHRNGTIYYTDPKPGQKGESAMPQPPFEADGTVAWHC